MVNNGEHVDSVRNPTAGNGRKWNGKAPTLQCLSGDDGLQLVVLVGLNITIIT